MNMQRRELLKSAAALATASLPLSALVLGRAYATGFELKTLGTPQTFDYAWLKGQARALSAQPYQNRAGAIPASLSGLNWDQWESIGLKEGRALWNNLQLNERIRFFHLGWSMRTPVAIY